MWDDGVVGKVMEAVRAAARVRGMRLDMSAPIARRSSVVGGMEGAQADVRQARDSFSPALTSAYNASFCGRGDGIARPVSFGRNVVNDFRSAVRDVRESAAPPLRVFPAAARREGAVGREGTVALPYRLADANRRQPTTELPASGIGRRMRVNIDFTGLGSDRDSEIARRAAEETARQIIGQLGVTPLVLQQIHVGSSG